MKLIIVESPTKAKTISRFLSREYTVESSYGHIRDLPKNKLGVDLENNFKPEYIIPLKARKTVSQLKKDAGKADIIILATDEDREGEAIAWHLTQALGLGNSKFKIQNSKFPPKVERIVFHEITQKAIEEALKNPRSIDINLVDAQQARRILDRLVGYKLSPLLWKKVARRLSAGRVQSVAVRLIVDREKEIENFKSEEYWTMDGEFAKIKNKPEIFLARLTKQNGKTIQKLDIKNKEESDKITKGLENAEYKISDIQKKEIKKNPLPPFTTSTLQQEAVKRLRFSAKKTMLMAQQLYEGINLGEKGAIGLITYMRTDSLNLSDGSVKQAEEFIKKEFGDNYSAPKKYKTKTKGAQEAHEAIRPTDFSKTPQSLKGFLDNSQSLLYNLIWQRALASQMAAAALDLTTVNIETKESKYVFRASGSTLRFDGFTRIYPIKFTETILPDLGENETVKLNKLIPQQHFTQPLARYSEATLVKTLEEYGIGRPSTYAPIMSTIQERGYVEKQEDRKFHPTEIGILVNDLLTQHFPDIVDVKFTARIEEDLDKIASGEKKWVPVIEEFYVPFSKNLAIKYKEIEKKELIEETDQICEKCGKPMVIRMGRYGKFLACSGFPECKNAKPLEKSEQEIDEKCEKCGSPMKIKRSRYGEFLGCSRYPECNFIKKLEKTTGMKCPKCKEGEIVIRRTKQRRTFYGCSKYPNCDYISWEKPKTENES